MLWIWTAACFLSLFGWILLLQLFETFTLWSLSFLLCRLVSLLLSRLLLLNLFLLVEEEEVYAHCNHKGQNPNSCRDQFLINHFYYLWRPFNFFYYKDSQ